MLRAAHWSVVDVKAINEPNWTVVGDGETRRVRLSGPWRLFLRSRARERLAGEFAEIKAPRSLAWDLTAIDGLDSAGAWLLWRTWDQRLPATLDCHGRDRHWFERLEALPAAAGDGHASVPPLVALGARIARVGGHTLGLFALFAGVMGDLARFALRPRLIPWREISASVYRTGASSMLLLGVTGFVIGVVMALQIGVTLSDFGANPRIIGLMGLAVPRELGPVITALIQVGRAGSSITAGIAGMHLTEELDALRTFGATPRMRLVTPKVVAMLVAMPLLVVWTDIAAVLGGAVTAALDLDVPFALFLSRLPHEVSLFNFLLGLAKGALFGLVIAVVSSYFGLKARASTDSLSAQTTTSVVTGLSLMLIVDAAFGAILAKAGLL